MLEPQTKTIDTEPPAPRPEAMPVAPPDLLLLERVRSQDPAAWQALMQRHNQRLYRIARSVLASADAAAVRVEEAYLHASAELPRFDPGGKLGGWLSQLAFAKAQAARREVVRAVRLTPDDDNAVLEQAIDELPEVFRTVFVLRVLEGVSGPETATCLGINETTVRTRLFRALRRLPPGAGARATAERNSLFKLEPGLSEQITKSVLARMRR
jgi:RNA polymerase sigma-70 factor, ECF subfamily